VRLACASAAMQSYALKLVLVGDSRVGKSQLSRAFMDKEFVVSSRVVLSNSPTYSTQIRNPDS
jgi:GTPase SAR1 family protein